MEKSPYHKAVSIVCIALYFAAICGYSALPFSKGNASDNFKELAYSASDADFSIHPFQPESSPNIIKNSGSSLQEKNSFKNLALQVEAMQVSSLNLIRYIQLCKNLVIRFSPVKIIFPFHSFW